MKMRKTLWAIGAFALFAILFTFPSVNAQTSVFVGVQSEENVDVDFDIDADGNVFVTIDGVDINKKLLNITDRTNLNREFTRLNMMDIRELEDVIESLINDFSSMNSEYNEIFSDISTELDVHDGRLNILLKNTIFNKTQFENLENRFSAFIACEFQQVVDSLEDTSGELQLLSEDYSDLKTDYLSLKEEYGKMSENYSEFYSHTQQTITSLETRSGNLEKQRTYASIGVLALLAGLGFANRKGIGGRIARVRHIRQ